MPSRPQVVAFDIIETTISLEPLRPIFIGAGLPDTSLEHWFSIGLRDAFALGVAGDYKPFLKVLESAVEELFAVHGLRAGEGFMASVEAAMRKLPAQPGALEAFQILHESDVRLFALTNGSHASTTKLLDDNGLLDLVEEVISTDQIGAPKPQPKVYRYLLERAGVPAEQGALVAAHGWDLHGAAAVGLTTAFVRHRKPFPEALHSPDTEAPSLPLLAQQLLDLTQVSA